MKEEGMHTIYDIAAKEFEIPNREVSLSILLLRMSGIFMTITLIVFLISNYEYIRSQFFTWEKAEAKEGNFSVDSDGDQIPDWWEEQHGFDAQSSRDASEDVDGDGISNLMEYRFGMNVQEPENFDEREEFGDSDGDGISDDWEIKNGLGRGYFEDASVDFDEDGLNNLEEFRNGTDPQSSDSDGDGLSDKEELDRGRNPVGPESLK